MVGLMSQDARNKKNSWASSGNSKSNTFERRKWLLLFQSRKSSHSIPRMIRLLFCTPISNDESSDCDSFVEVPHAESEGDLFEDATPAAPQSPLLPEAPNITPEGASVPQNPSPEGANTSPEGDNSCNCVWKQDKNNRLKLLKLNRGLYALTCGRQHQFPMAKKLSQKRKRLKYMQCCCQLKEESNMTVNLVNLDDSIPTIKELLDSQISKFITLAANDCGYSGTSEDLVVKYVHPLFLKAKAAASAEENPNWR